MATQVDAVLAPAQDDKDRFFSTMATSIAYAIGPLVQRIDNGKLMNITYAEKIFDPLHLSDDARGEFDTILKNGGDRQVVLFSSTYDSHNNSRRLAAQAKTHNPDILTVYGGPHVNEVAKPKVIEAMPQVYPFNEPNNDIDIIVQGPGEEVIPVIVEAHDGNGSPMDTIEYLLSDAGRQRLSELPGNSQVHVRDGEGKVHVLKTKSTPLDLSRYPTMPRKLFGNVFDRYGFSCFYEKGKDGKHRLLPSTSTMLHRGCLGRCIFCSEATTFNQRTLEHIGTELTQLKDGGFEGVFFDDSTISDHKDWPDLLKLLKKVGLQYGSLNRLDKLQDPEYVRALRAAGFVYQYCSFEQVADEVLKANGKGQNVEKIERGVKNLHDNGIELGVSLLFGIPGETMDSIKRTIDFTAEQVGNGPVVAVSMSLASFHPGTPHTLRTPEGKKMHQTMRFDCTPPNSGEPWNHFEEGQWFHPSVLTEERVRFIFNYANDKLGNVLVRNMTKDGSRIEP